MIFGIEQFQFDEFCIPESPVKSIFFSESSELLDFKLSCVLGIFEFLSISEFLDLLAILVISEFCNFFEILAFVRFANCVLIGSISILTDDWLFDFVEFATIIKNTN